MNLVTYIKAFDNRRSDSFIQHIAQNPLDRTGYGVYADWLMENDQDASAHVYMRIYDDFDHFVDDAKQVANDAVYDWFATNIDVLNTLREHVINSVRRWVITNALGVDRLIILSFTRAAAQEILAYVGSE